jgi:hypothetical protein
MAIGRPAAVNCSRPHRQCEQYQAAVFFAGTVLSVCPYGGLAKVFFATCLMVLINIVAPCLRDE